MSNYMHVPLPGGMSAAVTFFKGGNYASANEAAVTRLIQILEMVRDDLKTSSPNEPMCNVCGKPNGGMRLHFHDGRALL